MTHDAINSPSHYAEGRQFEPIAVIEDWELNYRLGNAVKYISRAGRKLDAIEDLRKAVWYLQREIDTLEGAQSPYSTSYEDVLTYYGQTVDEKEAWPEPERLRIYELARELGVTNEVVFDALDELGIEVKNHASSLKDGQVEEVRAFLCKEVPFEATDEDWEDFWSEDHEDALWDPSVGPVELSEKEITDILAKKDLDQFTEDEIVSTVERRGMIIGFKKDGSSCVLRNGKCA